MPSFVVHGAKSANQKNAALVTAADAAGAVAAATVLGVRVDAHAVATQVQDGDLSTPDVAFYGDAVGAPGNGTWPGQDRAA